MRSGPSGTQRNEKGRSALKPRDADHFDRLVLLFDTLAELTPRERKVLALMAEGRTNASIGRRLWLTEKTVQTHVRAILMKLGLPVNGEDHRRVVAVLTYLRASAQG